MHRCPASSSFEPFWLRSARPPLSGTSPTDTIAWSDNAAAVFSDIPADALASGAEFAKLIEPSRSVRTEALAACAAGARRRGRALPDRIRRARRDVRAGASGSRRPAAGLPVPTAGRRAPTASSASTTNATPATSTAETVAARSADRRTQSHPSDCLAGRGHRGSHALPLLLRLHADRHRSSGADQRRLRLRCRRRRDRRSRATHSRAAARRRRARPLLRQQVRPDPEELHGRRHQHRRRAVSAGIRDEVVPTKSGPVSITASIGAVSLPRYARNADEAINRAQETLDIAKRRRAGSFVAVAAQCRARRPAPRQHPRHRRDRHRAQRAPHRDGVRAGRRGPLARSRRSTNAWCAWSRATARCCWRPTSCRSPSSSA